MEKMKTYLGIMTILILVGGLVAGCGGSSTPDEITGPQAAETSMPESVTTVSGAPSGVDSSVNEEAIGQTNPELPTTSSETSPIQSTPSVEPTQPEVSSSSTSTPGTLEVLVMDAPPEYEITSIQVTISGVEVHQTQANQDQDQDRDREQDGESDKNNKNKDKQKTQGNSNGRNDDEQQGATPDENPSDESDAVVENDSDDSGWISLDIQGTFDLLLLQGIPEALGESYLDSGKYTQIRVAVDSVIVEYLDGTSSDAQTAEATVPSGKLKFVRPFNIEAGKTTKLLFDFIADKAFVFTGSDKVIFKPVIKLQVFEPQPTVDAVSSLPDLNITTTSLSDGIVDEFYSVSLEAAGGITPYAWSWSGTLPGGLDLDATTGIISGTPTAAGDYAVTAQVNDSDDHSDMQIFNISIDAAVDPLEITTTSLPDGETGIAYSDTLEASGGIIPYAWSWSGTLPGGLVLDASTGAISGTPTAAGEYAVTVQVDDSDTQSDEQVLNISISAAVIPLEITTTSLPDGEAGIAYTANVEASGGIVPYAWSWSGTLPGGLVLDTDTGVISGTPSAAGEYAVTVQVDDSDTQSDEQVLNISISAAVIPLEITTTSLPDGEAGIAYTANVEASGGVKPYTWSWSGTLPDGLVLDTGTGAISGTPTAAGEYTVTVQVDDSSAQSDTVDFNIHVE